MSSPPTTGLRARRSSSTGTASPPTRLQDRFDSFLKANLVGGLAPDVADRVLSGPSDFVVRSADGSREMQGRGIVGIILPFALGLFISFALMSAAGYLVRAVADEKESRTIEIMTTSVSPEQLIAGKAVGLVGVALTQVFLWAVVVLGGLAVASNFVDSLRGMEISVESGPGTCALLRASVHSGSRAWSSLSASR